MKFIEATLKIDWYTQSAYACIMDSNMNTNLVVEYDFKIRPEDANKDIIIYPDLRNDAIMIRFDRDGNMFTILMNHKAHNSMIHLVIIDEK